MGLLIKDLVELTGLTEEKVKEKLVQATKRSSLYAEKRANYDTIGLASTYPDSSMGFITWVLGSDPHALAKIIK